MLEREEYIEQAHLFRILGERLPENIPIQEALAQTREEILTTTRLPLAIDFLLAELKHTGTISSAMQRLPHYFTGFQTYVVSEAEAERGKFDIRIALAVLHAEAKYRTESPSPQGVFMYQFETLCRNRLRYDPGLAAMATDPIFEPPWREWILTVRRQIGLADLADLIYVRSEFCRQKVRPDVPIENLPAPLFGEKEGRIALANRRKDPLFLFAALQRHLQYPIVPRPKKQDDAPHLIPQLLRRIERLETRIKLLEDEEKGGIDITRFYQRPGMIPPGGDV